MNPPVEAPASRATRPATSMPKRSSAAPSFSPPRETNRRAGAARTIGSSGPTSVPALAAGRPPTVTFPDRMASPASDRVVAMARLTISTSSRRRTSPMVHTERRSRADLPRAGSHFGIRIATGRAGPRGMIRAGGARSVTRHCERGAPWPPSDRSRRSSGS